MIVSTTLTGSNADIIGDALASVLPQVDRCIVIDTGAKDATLEVARQVAGEKLLLREFPWKNDFAAARNFALEAAVAAGAQWAVTVDTDERLMFGAGFDLRAALRGHAGEGAAGRRPDGVYAKERIIRLPTTVRWAGPTHEALLGQRPGESEVLAGRAFQRTAQGRGDAAPQVRARRRRCCASTPSSTRRTRAGTTTSAPRTTTSASTRQPSTPSSLRLARRLGRGGRLGLLPRGRVLLRARALEGRHRLLRAGARDPSGHGRARLARGPRRLQGEALRGRHRLVEHGAGERPVRRRGRGVPARRLPQQLALYEGPYEVLRWTFKALGNAEAPRRRPERESRRRGGQASAPRRNGKPAPDRSPRLVALLAAPACPVAGQ